MQEYSGWDDEGKINDSQRFPGISRNNNFLKKFRVAPDIWYGRIPGTEIIRPEIRQFNLLIFNDNNPFKQLDECIIGSKEKSEVVGFFLITQ